MSLEVAAVISSDEKDVLFWHMPEDRQSAFLPDSKVSQMMVPSESKVTSLWDALVKHRDEMAGTVHIHPWHGGAIPSTEDITSYEVFECWRGYKRRYTWWVATFSELVAVRWQGPGKYDYSVATVPADQEPRWVEELRSRARLDKTSKQTAASAAEV